MKNISKVLTSIGLIILMLTTNGCLSAGAIEKSNAYSSQPVTPAKGDTIFAHKGSIYVIQNHRQNDPALTNSAAIRVNQGKTVFLAYKPENAWFFAALPLTVPVDTVLLPFYAIGGGLTWLMFSNYHGC